MKRFLNILIVIISFVLVVSPVFALNSEKIAVIPVDLRERNANYSVYSDTLYLVTNDLINTLNTKYKINTLDLTFVEGIVSSHNLSSDYHVLLRDYKNTYTINHVACSKIAKKLDADKIILITGDFDTENMVFEKGLINRLEIIGIKPFKPSYRMNLLFTMIDVHSGNVVFEKNYKKLFPISDFTSPMTKYNNYSVSVGSMKKFSKKISHSVSNLVRNAIYSNTYTTVNSHIINTNNPIEDKYDSTFTTKEGITTKDGQSSTISKEHKSIYSTNRKDNYKQWVKSNLP